MKRQHCIIALDTLSYDDERGLCNSATANMSAEAIRRGEHLATPELRGRFKATVKRFRNTFTPEFVESCLLEIKEGLDVEIVSDIRSPADLRGRNHRISFVVFAFLNACDDDQSDDLVYFSSSTLKLLTQRAKSMNTASSVFIVVLIPGEHRNASMERFKQLQFEADGQMVGFPQIDAASSILPVFVDAKQHMATESRRRLAFALTNYADLFVEDTSAHQSLETLRKLVEVGVSDYAVSSRKRTVDGEPVMMSVWSNFLAANQEQVDEDKKINLLALVRSFITGNDTTVALPSADALSNASDNDYNYSRQDQEDDDEMFFNR